MRPSVGSGPAHPPDVFALAHPTLPPRTSSIVPVARFCAPGSLLLFSPSSRPTPIEGLAERREAHSLRNVARVRRDATLARHGPLPVQPEDPPLGAPPWRVGPFPPFRSRHCRRVRREGHSPPGVRAWSR